jgi:hypothetical protein
MQDWKRYVKREKMSKRGLYRFFNEAVHMAARRNGNE